MMRKLWGRRRNARKGTQFSMASLSVLNRKHFWADVLAAMGRI